MVSLYQLGGGARAVGDHFKHRAMKLLRHLLGQSRDSLALGDHAFAIIGFQITGDQLEQGRLALAVAPHQTDALTGLDRQIDTVNQGGVAVAQV